MAEAPQSVGVPLSSLQSSPGSAFDLASRGVDLKPQQQTPQSTVQFARRLLKRQWCLGSGSDVEGRSKMLRFGGHESGAEIDSGKKQKAKSKAKAKSKSSGRSTSVPIAASSSTLGHLTLN